VENGVMKTGCPLRREWEKGAKRERTEVLCAKTVHPKKVAFYIRYFDTLLCCDGHMHIRFKAKRKREQEEKGTHLTVTFLSTNPPILTLSPYSPSHIYHCVE
jgi:hypothetical protein